MRKIQNFSVYEIFFFIIIFKNYYKLVRKRKSKLNIVKFEICYFFNCDEILL